MADYYRVDGNYAGTTFCEVEPNDPFTLNEADLWAVTTLSVKVPPREGRRLLDPGRLRTTVHRHLRRLPVTLPLTDLEDDTLDTMFNLYSELREIASTDARRDSNWWVLASKLCARKRPELFPVRDALVCGFLSGGKPLGHRAGPGTWAGLRATSRCSHTSSPTRTSGSGCGGCSPIWTKTTRCGSMAARCDCLMRRCGRTRRRTASQPAPEQVAQPKELQWVSAPDLGISASAKGGSPRADPVNAPHATCRR